jgi:para-nitrobenzyl esterase
MTLANSVSKIAILLIGLLPLSALGVAIKTETGILKGINLDGVSVFKGVRFAQPPIEALRWKATRPLPPSSQSFDALSFGASCLQFTEEEVPQVAGKEDCLFLNVWTPSINPNAKLPVLIFIHGGAFVVGSGSLYDGRDLAEVTQSVVVTLNYRLGPMGFIGHPELSKEAAHKGSGNYGLMDQIEALRWVQRNIGSFGGNNKQVFLFGQSAGAQSTLALLSSPRAAGLFTSAALISGGDTTVSLQDAEEKGQRLARNVGLSDNDPQILEKLRSLPGDVILKNLSSSGMIGQSASVHYLPNADGWILPKTQLELLAAGSYNRVPTLVTSTLNEWGNMAKYYLPLPTRTAAEY